MVSLPRFRFRLSCVLLAAVLGACGGDDDPAPPVDNGGGNGGDNGGNDGGGATDQQPPQATLTAPAALATGLTGDIALTATASDDVGVTAVEFEADGGPVGPPDTTAPSGATVSVANHPPGQHIVRARARDASGKVSAWSSATVRFGGTAKVPAGFTLTESWVAGIARGTAMAQAPDGRLFIAQQGGDLRVVKDGALLPAPFASFTVDGNGERGLIGVAVHPDFATNGWVFVHYTSPAGGAHGRIARLVANGDVSDGSETVLVDLPVLSSATNHNGGALHFGTDGKLYVAVGDNAQRTLAPRLDSVFGKLLRFNDDGTIPTDNPHAATQAGLARAIWAHGLRNPFTFAVQPVTGTLYVNDVGENTWEEINLVTAGANLGWPATEGPTTEAGVTAPLFAYRQTDTDPPGSGPGGFFTGQSIAGGAFYPASGGSFPAPYASNYFFADHVAKSVGRLDPANGNAATSFARMAGNPVDVLAGNDGALYVLSRNSLARITVP